MDPFTGFIILKLALIGGRAIHYGMAQHQRQADREEKMARIRAQLAAIDAKYGIES